MLLKASRINSLTDARYFAAQEATYLGFCLEEGAEGYLDPMYMKAIREWVEGPKIVGEFPTASANIVAEAARFYGLEAVQVSEHVLPDLKVPEGVEVLVSVQVKEKPEILAARLAPLQNAFQFVLLHFTGPGAEVQASAWQPFMQQFPVILHMDWQASTIRNTLDLLHPAGISITGGEEEAVGVKSFDDIDDLLAAL